MSIAKKKPIFTKLAPLMAQPYFTAQQAKQIGVAPALLAYYSNTGLIKRVQRGVYQSPATSTLVSVQWGDLLQAMQGIPQGVVCLHTALSIYGYSEEKNRQYWIAIPHSTSVKTNKLIKVVRLRNISLGKTSIMLDGVSIAIFDRERTLIDAFRQLGIETAIKALKIAITKKGNEKLDLIKLQQYAKKSHVNIEPYLLAIGT